MEAFTAFQAAHGAEVRHYDASKGKPGVPPGTRTVVAFGTRAASQSYPAWVNVVYCMTPGVVLDPQGREGRTVRISVLPGFGLILAKLKELQPSLKRLRVFWMMQDFAPYVESAKTLGEEFDITVTPVKADGIAQLPGLLRRGMGEMDAFWLPPDPFLITNESLTILRDFSWANAIPFYAPTKGLTREGAAAAVGVSFADMGAAAAAAVKDLEAGGTPAPVIFPGKVELTLSAAAAKKFRLEFQPEALLRAGNLLP